LLCGNKNCATVSQSISNTIEFFAIQMYNVIVAQSPQGKNVLENNITDGPQGPSNLSLFPFGAFWGALQIFFFF
jgi:hypothetical protein